MHAQVDHATLLTQKLRLIFLDPSFHVDHAASLPYVLAKTNFRGRVFMTHPTKAIYKWLIQDSVRVGYVLDIYSFAVYG